jgi:hypothetical protein
LPHHHHDVPFESNVARFSNVARWLERKIL